MLHRTALIVLATASCVLGQESHTVTFDDGANEGGWTFFWALESIEPAGGNPGWYLHGDCPDPKNLQCMDVPFLRTGTTWASSFFTGNLREKNVTTMGIDAILHWVGNTAAGRPMSLVLFNDNGTPGDPFDDCFAYSLGADIPLPGQGWISYDYEVPSQSKTLPQGWNIFFECNSDPDAQWNRIIQDTTKVFFTWAHPESFAIFQMWDPGVDNIRVTVGSVCQADCDGNGELNTVDFLCYLNLFSNGDPLADFNGDGVVNTLDFLAYLNAFNAGCG